VINARAKIGDKVYVGSNASILPDLRIGEGATIAGNTLVVSDVPPGATAIGVPATILDPRAIHAASDESKALETAPAVMPSETHLLEYEDGIAQVVSDVLKRVAISHAANFFDLGGNSHKALQVCDALRTRYGWSVQILDLFRHPTIQGLARAVAGQTGGGGPVPGSAGHISAAQHRAAMRRASVRG